MLPPTDNECPKSNRFRWQDGMFLLPFSEAEANLMESTKIIADDKDAEKSKYVINVKQIAKFVVNLGERVSPTDIEEGMRVG